MNISEFEQRLRNSNKQPVPLPDEEKWRKLEAALQPPKKRVVLLPWSKKTMLAAASIALVATVGVYTFYNSSDKDTASIVHEKVRSNTIVEQRASVEPTQATQTAQVTQPIQPIQKLIPENYVAKPAVTNKELIKHSIIPAKQVQPFVPQRSGSADDSILITQTPAPRSKLPMLPKEYDRKQNERLQPDEEVHPSTPSASRVTFGVAALFGFSNISKSQYKLSVNANKPISDRLFASVQVVASNANILVSNAHEYQALSFGGPGASPESSTQDVEAVYTGNVVSLGVTPSIGFKINKTFALIAGPDLQKTLSGKVALKNGGEFANKMTSSTLVEEKQQVSDFDLGVQSTAQINLSKRAAVNVMYRYGFGNYIRKESGISRNSFLGIGLSYNLR